MTPAMRTGGYLLVGLLTLAVIGWAIVELFRGDKS